MSETTNATTTDARQDTAGAFEKASRLRLRFATAIGILTVEDLWDLPLTSQRSVSLDDVARALNKELKETETESFVIAAPVKDTTTQLMFDLVKHVIAVRLAEAEEARTAKDRRDKKQKLLGIIARKQDQALEETSVEDLTAMVEAL